MYRRKEKNKIMLKKIKDIVYSPIGNISDGMDIDIKSDHEIYIDGCIGIGEFTDKKIIFLGKNMNVILSGNSFELYSFDDRCLKACGKIDNVEIIRGVDND